MSAVAAAALALLKRIPAVAWVLLAVLGWGAWQKHQADAAAAELLKRQRAEEQARADTIRDALVESTRRTAATKGIADAAQQTARRLASDRDAARAAADDALRRLRDAAAVRDAGGAADPGARAGSAPAGPADVVPADVLGRCAARVLELADYADRARSAGDACEQSYRALTP